MLSLVAVYLLIASTCEEKSSDKKSEGLIESLRKKLTENNYDYSSGESIEVHRRAEPRDSSTTAAATFRHTPKFNKQYTKTLYLREAEPNVSQNDLLYYLDDRHLLPNKPPVKYKLLRAKHKSRRSGGAQLLQEESRDGVAIINLGSGPIPQFRLPRARRQYMHYNEELISDEEDEPPYLNVSSAGSDVPNFTA